MRRERGGETPEEELKLGPSLFLLGYSIQSLIEKTGRRAGAQAPAAVLGGEENISRKPRQSHDIFHASC